MNVRRAFDRLHTPRTPGIQDGQISRYSRNSRNDAGHAVFRGFTVCTIVVFSAASANAHIPVGAKLHQDVDGNQFDLRSKRYSGVIRLHGVKSMGMRGCCHQRPKQNAQNGGAQVFQGNCESGFDSAFFDTAQVSHGTAWIPIKLLGQRPCFAAEQLWTLALGH